MALGFSLRVGEGFSVSCHTLIGNRNCSFIVLVVLLTSDENLELNSDQEKTLTFCRAD